ncbi:MAG: hypothetical protein HY288_00960 [Planctomycetia bacterium]|nr:hypothetical protein [Planctomycetia bacterium]
MVRSTKWIAVAVGLLILFGPARELPAQAPQLSSAGLLRPGRADQVVEMPDAGDDADARVVESNSIDTSSLNAGEVGSSLNADIPQALSRPEASDSIAPDQQNIEVIKERFADGSVKIEREVTQDAQGNYVNHGAWKMWDQQGNLVAQGQYRFGSRTGTWIRWYRTVSDNGVLGKMPYQQFVGPFISQATFKNDQLHGVWIIYDGKKHIISQWKFVDGKRDGTAVWLFANGRRMREIQYHDGDIDGQFREWNSESKLIINDTYQAGRKLAQKTARHPGATKKSEGSYLFAKDVEQTPDDWWNCKLQVTTKQGKDEKHGPWISWYSNGQRQLVGTYEHDVQVGQFTWWHTNGQKALEGRFESGKQDGVWTWWYPSGQKSIHGEYAHGNPTGRWTWWKEDGKVAQSADLSHSEGIVVETPRNLEPNALPHATKVRPRVQPLR